MPKPADLNRCLAPLDQDHTIIAVIEMSQSSWLVAGVVPGIARHPLKKLAPDQDALLKLLHRWRAEAGQAGREITRIAVAFAAGRDGFWVARWLRAHGIEAHVIHPTSIAVAREHRRAKTQLEHLIWSSIWACRYFREIHARVALRRGGPRRFGGVRGGADTSGGGEVARTRAGSVIPANLISAGIAPVASVRTVQVLPPLSTVASWSWSRSRRAFSHSGVIPASAQLSKSSFW